MLYDDISWHMWLAAEKARTGASEASAWAESSARSREAGLEARIEALEALLGLREPTPPAPPPKEVRTLAELDEAIKQSCRDVVVFLGPEFVDDM